MMMYAFQDIGTQLPGLAFAEQSIDSVKGYIFPQERIYIQNAVLKRQQEFIAGRILARRAWKGLGFPDHVLLADDQRCPIWPEGIVGSISHSDYYCGAVVGASSSYRSIGFDIEQIAAMNFSLWPIFCTHNEQRMLHKLPALKQQEQAALIFSAKESIYKCHFQIHRFVFRFHDIEIIWNRKHSRFSFSILNKAIPPMPSSHHNGLFGVSHDHVYTIMIQKSEY